MINGVSNLNKWSHELQHEPPVRHPERRGGRGGLLRPVGRLLRLVPARGAHHRHRRRDPLQQPGKRPQGRFIYEVLKVMYLLLN